MSQSRISGALIIVSAIGASANLNAAEPRAPKHVTADQAMMCIKAAIGARAGSIRELEVKVESNRTVCEVEVIAADGKKHEVYIDVGANKVLRVED